MASRAPSYYHWSMDKPVTTNQTYGFELKPEMAKYAHLQSLKPQKPIGPFDYTRPFSNMGFFPDIPDERKGLTVGQRHMRSRSTGLLDKTCKGVPNKFNINDGYVMGPVPVSSRVRSRRHPAEVQLINFEATPQVYVHPKPKTKDIYLWHSLAGCLVHAKNPVKETFKSQIVY